MIGNAVRLLVTTILFLRHGRVMLGKLQTCSINPLLDNKIKTSKLKEFADDNFKFDENGRKLSKRVENTVGKGEIACYEQFLLFPQCFQKACFPGASKGVTVWEWFKHFNSQQILYIKLVQNYSMFRQQNK